jgi:hypothetical protein
MAASNGFRRAFPLAASLVIGIAVGRFWPRAGKTTPFSAPVPVTAAAPVQTPAPQFPTDFAFNSPVTPPSYFRTDWASYNWASYGPYRVQPVIQRSAPDNATVYNLLLVHKRSEPIPPKADLYLLDPNPSATKSLISNHVPELSLKDRNPPPAPEPKPQPALEHGPAW